MTPSISGRIRALAANDYQAVASKGMIGLCVGTLEALFSDSDRTIRTAKRHTLTTYLVGSGSSKDWTVGEVNALLKWATTGDGPTHAPVEAQRIVLLYEADHGQQQLL
jgi:hypothetical protein